MQKYQSMEMTRGKEAVNEERGREAPSLETQLRCMEDAVGPIPHSHEALLVRPTAVGKIKRGPYQEL